MASKCSVTVVTDITEGEAYQKQAKNDQTSEGVLNLTALCNTDGINLYSSSKIELWPIFSALNELSPGLRFSRENIILAGIWQGKGKPPFQHFIKAFSDELNKLSREGFRISVGIMTVVVKIVVICVTVDLPDKAELLCMVYFNGRFACVTCADEGEVAKQGRGHAMTYPYNDQSRLRSPSDVENAMQNGTKKKPNLGFKGTSSMCLLDNFCVTTGIVPDYMHCVLLGVTKTLLQKWFSPSQSKNEYYVGGSLKTVSRRLQSIKPPDYIERLPRDLEKHYANLKATELQAWLLFYSIPCLAGRLY